MDKALNIKIEEFSYDELLKFLARKYFLVPKRILRIIANNFYDGREDFSIKLNNKTAGFISIKDIDSGKSCEISYTLFKKYRGKGIMTQALDKFMNYIENELGFENIYANVIEDNIPSIKVLEKNRFRETESVKKGNGTIIKYSFSKKECIEDLVTPCFQKPYK